MNTQHVLSSAGQRAAEAPLRPAASPRAAHRMLKSTFAQRIDRTLTEAAHAC